MPERRHISVRKISVRKIISGGQTGADRGGLDAAIALGIAHGGWCPRGRRAEDGTIPARYSLCETESRDYAVRTEHNILAADATLIISRGSLLGGSALTARLAANHGKPHLHIDLAEVAPESAASRITDWLRRGDIAILNVAGPRASNCPGIADEVRTLLMAVFASTKPSA